MIHELENPFSVTKATEFSDQEINEYWVNFNTREEVSIESILNPNEFLAKYVIGGKGCGKTHILRYFSFPLQKIRYSNNVENLLQRDRYVGLYSILGGLNSSRFKGKGISEAEWEAIFEYYFELYICDSLLHTIQQIFAALHVSEILEGELVDMIASIFRVPFTDTKLESIEDLIQYLYALRSKVDLQVLNAAFTRKLDYEEIKVLFTPGDLLFGIPDCISKSLQQFEAVKFIFILDEYEKLFEWQKSFVNTLVWDKKGPVTFWIGARRYGYTNRSTKSGEMMKQGSEYQEVNLDIIIRSNEDIYKRFVEKLCQNRLVKYYQQKNIHTSGEELLKKFREKFEKYSEERLLDELAERNKRKGHKFIKDLRKKLLEGIKNKTALTLTEAEIDGVVAAVEQNTDNNPLDQKYKVFFLYKAWYNAKKGTRFSDLVKNMNEEYLKFKRQENSDYKEIKDKRKKDFLAQLCKDNGIKNAEYLGMDKFIELSQGNARSFILTLKKTIEFSKIRGEKPLEDGGSISLESQYLAVYDTARWFYEDVEVIGPAGKQLYDSLKNLTDYFRIHRFCDKPTETTLSCFYIKGEDLSNNALACIENMKVHSILIEDDDGRLEKNTGRKERMFQLNKMLAPLWNLPIVERGSIYLNKDIAEAIFDLDHHNRFDKIYEKRKSELTAPDFLKASTGQSNSLFK